MTEEERKALQVMAQSITVLAHRCWSLLGTDQATELRNGDKMDNRAENLEYVTHADNIRHGRRVLGKQRGEGNHRAKLTEELVLKIRSEYEPYVMGYRKLGHRYGICFTHVRSIVKGRVWSHVQALKAAKP